MKTSLLFDAGAPALMVILDLEAARHAPDALARAIVAGGGRLIQIRGKQATARALMAATRAALDAMAPVHGAVVVNDRVDVALACGAHGVHLPAAGLLVQDARRLLGPDALIGASAHDAAELAAARAQGASYATLSPFAPTPSKPGYGPALGEAGLAALRPHAGPMPVLALGGVSPANVAACLRAGAQGVAVMGGVIAADDPEAVVRALASPPQNLSILPPLSPKCGEG